ncbi:hypothetical protein TNCV_3158341 [Trichonephila clavipes]|nr:hypothetical protein TNCV_3158341 [Trichonephila clavipes]
MSRCWEPFHHRVNDESSSEFTPGEMVPAGFCAEGMCFHSKFSVRVSILETRFIIVAFNFDLTVVLFPPKLEIGILILFCGALNGLKSNVTILDMLPKTARAWVQLPVE